MSQRLIADLFADYDADAAPATDGVLVHFAARLIKLISVVCIEHQGNNGQLA